MIKRTVAGLFILINLGVFVFAYAQEYGGYDNGGENGIIESGYRPEEEWKTVEEAMQSDNDDFGEAPAEDSATQIEDTFIEPAILPEGGAPDTWQWLQDIGKFIGDRAQDAWDKIEELSGNIIALGLKNDNYAIREKSVQILADMGTPGIKTLISALNGTSEETRDIILEKLSGVIKYKELTTAEQEQIVVPLLDFIADKNLDSQLKSDVVGISWGIMASDHKTDDSVKEKIREGIAQNVINERNSIFWEKFGVVVLETERALKDGESTAIYNVLNSLPLPQNSLPPVISLERTGRLSSGEQGSYNPNTALITLDYSSENANFKTTQTLFHEIGHRIDFINQFSFGQNADWGKLWGGSKNRYDYASAYGSSNISEDFATMFEAYTRNSEGLWAQAKENAQGGRGILLQKTEFVAKIFSHTVALPDGSSAEYTYLFKTEENGTVIRKEVPLATTKLR